MRRVNKQTTYGFGSIIILGIIVWFGLGQYGTKTDSDEVVDTTQKDYTQLQTNMESDSSIPEVEVNSIIEETPVQEDSVLAEESEDLSIPEFVEFTPEDKINRLGYQGTQVVHEGESGLLVGDSYNVSYGEMDTLGRTTAVRSTLTDITNTQIDSLSEPLGYNQNAYYQYINAPTQFSVYTTTNLIPNSVMGESDAGDIKNRITLTTDASKEVSYYHELIESTISKGFNVEVEMIPNYLEDEIVPRSITVRLKSSNNELDSIVTIFNVQEGVSINYKDATNTAIEGVTYKL